MEKTNPKRKKSTPKKVDFAYRNSEPSDMGLIPAMLALVALLPKDWQPHGERIVAIVTLSLLAMISLYMIGVIAPSFGGSDQITNYCSMGVYAVAFAAAGAIVLTFRKKVV